VRKVVKIILGLIAIAGIAGIAYVLLHNANIPVLNPQGEIADKQRQLIIFTVTLGMFVIVPVFVMLFSFAWKYREGNTKQKYTPNDGTNKWIEGLWWGIPILIIGVLSVVTWQSSHDLDPYKKLSSSVKPVKVQVVALQWRWLFIYPDEGIATINELRMPEKTPVNFELTADAPMNGFWIPSLGSQVYAMSGMTSQLSLMADSTGEYAGSSSNISGKGYAGMNFKAISMSTSDYNAWVKKTAGTGKDLDWNKYSGEIAKPTENSPVSYYVVRDNDLFRKVIMKYMSEGESHSHEDMEDPAHSHSEMEMH
jgi:cytochrome o ubiquinol oxidase subunit 2